MRRPLPILLVLVVCLGAELSQAAGTAIFDQFNDWRGSYAKASVDQQPAFVSEGVALAQQRRVAMKDLLRLNPRDALDRSIPAVERSRLPEAIAALVERWVSGLGDIVMCPSNTPTAGVSGDGLAREVRVGQETFAGYVYGVRLVDQNFSKTPVNGVVIDDQMAVAESPVRYLARAEITSMAVGSNQVAVQAGVETKVFDSESQVAQYERELMFGRGMPTPTPEHEAEIQRLPKIARVRPNALGLARMNERRQAKGMRALSSKDVDVAPLGEEFILEGEPNSAPAGSGAVSAAPTVGETTASGATDNSALQYFPPINSQGGLGSCACYSTTYYQMTHMTALARGWNAKTGGDGYRFSPKWTYNMVNGGADSGSWEGSALNIGRDHGLATMSEFPYDSNYRAWCMNSNVWRNAIDRRMNSYYTIGSLYTSNGLANLKAVLDNGYVATFDTYAPWSYRGWVQGSVGNDPATSSDDAYVGQQICKYVRALDWGHALTIVGYNDNIWVDLNGNGTVDPGEKGALKIANSWGSWANSGYAWFAYDALNNVSGVSGFSPTDKVYGFGSGGSGSVLCYVITAKPSYSPAMVARFTINHAQRNQIVMKVGKDSTSVKANPATSWTPSGLNGSGGAYAFDGTSTACDGTFYLDLTGVNPTLNSLTRYFLGMYDNSTAGASTLKSVTFIDTTNSASVTIIPASNPTAFNPATGIADNGTSWAFVDYDSDAPNIVTDRVTLIAESCLPTNGVVDSGEIVTVNVALRNSGKSAVSNLVATLQAVNGVTVFSGAQNYGLLAPGASAVSRPFTFSVTNAFGSTAQILLQWQDGTNSSGSVNASFVIGTYSTVFSERFDGVTAPSLPPGWTTLASGGQSVWGTTTTTNDSSPNSAVSPDPATVGLNELVSPVVSVVSSNAQLIFRHLYNTEAGFDGGVLNIKVGSGSFVDILSAGGTLTTGGYNGTLSTAWSCPLGGRSAWSGNSGGFVTTTAKLPPACAGQTVQFKWQCGTDDGTSGTGWYVDTVALNDLIARDRAVSTDVPNLCLTEGTTTTCRVRLPDQPSTVTTVSVVRVSGDAGVAVASGATLVFGTNNWAVWQSVTVAAAKDADSSNSAAVVRFSAPGYLPRDVVVTGLDYDCGVPTGVDASDGLFKSRVNVSWNNATNALVYEVWRNTSSATATATRVAAGLTGTRWSDTSAVSGSNYMYWVKSVNNTCTSDFSVADLGSVWPAYLKWGYKTQLKFSGYGRSEALTNFPLLVTIGTNLPGFAYGQMASPVDAGDLRFADAGETMLLNHEPDLWTTGGVSKVWVQVPVLTNNGSIWMYWGNPMRKMPPACTTNGAVWDETFRGVWHLSEATGTLLDSTRNRNSGTRTGTAVGLGSVGMSQSFNSTSSNQVDCGNAASLQSLTNLTLSMWVNPTALSGERGLASKWGSSWCWVLNHDGTDVAGRPGLYFNGWKTATTAVATGQWSHVAVSYSQGDGAMLFYLNGQPDGSMTQATGPGVGANLRFGTRQDGGGSYFDGSMDEIRVESVKRSSNWIWACCVNMLSNQMFMSCSDGVTNLMTLTVASAITSAPAAGTYTYLYGQSVTSSVTSPLYIGGVMYYLSGTAWTLWPCEGASSFGPGSTLVVKMTNDMSLAWTCYQSYLFTTTTNAVNGSVSSTRVTGSYCASNQPVTLTGITSSYYHFSGWSGDVDAGQVLSNPVTVLMTKPRTVVGTFAENLATNGTPQWWLAQYGWTNTFDSWALADPDGDGMANWQEYIAGTDPMVCGSRLAISNSACSDVGRNILSWPGMVGRVYSIERCTNLMGSGFDLIVSNLPGVTPMNVYTDSFSGTRVFYRIKASKAP